MMVVRRAVAEIALAQAVLEHPGRYPTGAATRYRGRLPNSELNAGPFAEERGDLGLARFVRHGFRSA